MASLSVMVDDETAARLHAIAASRHENTERLIAEVLKAFTDSDSARWDDYEQTGISIANSQAVEWMEALERGEDRPCPA
jgi:predicted transcriptional regulator